MTTSRSYSVARKSAYQARVLRALRADEPRVRATTTALADAQTRGALTSLRAHGLAVIDHEDIGWHLSAVGAFVVEMLEASR